VITDSEFSSQDPDVDDQEVNVSLLSQLLLERVHQGRLDHDPHQVCAMHRKAATT